MGRDNKDRYGRRHRKDDAYNMGESAPGTTGDSEGTFHDRASSDNNVIVGGKAQNYETHKRKQESKSGSKGKNSSQNHNGSNKNKTKTNSFADLEGEVIEVEVERVSGSGNPLAQYQGTHVHVPGGEPGESYEVKLEAESGYFIGDIRMKE